jgi:hypothetical protein
LPAPGHEGDGQQDETGGGQSQRQGPSQPCPRRLVYFSNRGNSFFFFLLNHRQPDVTSLQGLQQFYGIFFDNKKHISFIYTSGVKKIAGK